MRFVVFGKQNLTLEIELVSDHLAHPEFLLQPKRHRLEEGGQTSRDISQIGFQQTLEFHERLVVEHDVGQFIGRGETTFLKTVTNRMGREIVIVLFSRKTLFLSGRNDFAVDYERGGAIVVIR